MRLTPRSLLTMPAVQLGLALEAASDFGLIRPWRWSRLGRVLRADWFQLVPAPAAQEHTYLLLEAGNP